MTPGDSPIGNLARAISSLRPTDELSEVWHENIESCLRRSKFGMRVALSFFPELANGGHVVIVVDQFEELFRFADLQAKPRSESATVLQNRDEATEFFRLLLEADSIHSIRVHVVLTMRSDYFGDCSLFYGLPEAVTRQLFLVPGLTRDQRARAITRPVVEKAGGGIDPELVQRLLNDTNEELDQLSIIQHTMMRCWQSAVERSTGGSIHVDVGDYKRIGEVKGALSKHASQLFQEFESFDRETKPAVSQQLVAKQVFQALTEVDRDLRVIRRPMKFGDLVRYVGSSEWNEEDTREAVLSVVLRLAMPNCSFLRIKTGDDVQDIDDDSVVDIGHEALIRRWSRLNGDGETNWVREEQEDGERYRDLVRRARAGGIVGGAERKSYESWWADRKPTATWAKRCVGDNHDYLAEVTEALARSRKALDDSERAKALAEETKREADRAKQRELEAEAARERASLAAQKAKAEAEAERARASAAEQEAKAAAAELEAEGARASAAEQEAKAATAQNALHRQQVRVRTIAGSAVVLLAIAAATGNIYYRDQADYADRQRIIAADNQKIIADSILGQVDMAQRIALPLRDRLLMLVDLSVRSEVPSVRTALGEGSNPANKVLAALLLRSPVFGASGPAALGADPHKDSLTYLRYSPGATTGKIINVDLPKKVTEASDLDLVGLDTSAQVNAPTVLLNKLAGAETDGVPLAPPTIGFIAPAVDKAPAPEAVVVVSPGRLSALRGTISGEGANRERDPLCEDSWENENQTSRQSGGDKNGTIVLTPGGPVTEEIRLGEFGRGLFSPQVEFGNNSLLVTSMSFGPGGFPITFCVLPLQQTQSDKGGIRSGSAADIAFNAEDGFPRQIDWNPIYRQARRIPVLASDCEKFVILGAPVSKTRTEVQAQRVSPVLYGGEFSTSYGVA